MSAIRTPGNNELRLVTGDLTQWAIEIEDPIANGPVPNTFSVRAVLVNCEPPRSALFPGGAIALVQRSAPDDLIWDLTIPAAESSDLASGGEYADAIAPDGIALLEVQVGDNAGNGDAYELTDWLKVFVEIGTIT